VETGSNNIEIGTAGPLGDESNTMRIGDPNTQTATYIAGVTGAGIAGGVPVVVNAAGQLGTVTGGSTRFTDNGDGTVTDHTTGLMWEMKDPTIAVGTPVDCSSVTCSNPQNVNNMYQWCQDADHNGACDNNGPYGNHPPDGGAFFDFLARTNGALCNSATCTGLGGHTDWRLPTVAELTTIVDKSATGCGPSSPCIDPIFGPTKFGYHWSATTNTGNSGQAWVVCFGSSCGSYAASKPYAEFYVRAVRGGL
jgi:hypothetical protein